MTQKSKTKISFGGNILKFRRFLASLICFALLLASFSAVSLADGDGGASKYEGNLVYISDNGDDSEDGTAEYPVKTLKRAFELLSNGENTERASGGYIIVKDVITLCDSEQGKVTSTADKGRYTIDLTGYKNTNPITICGADEDAVFRFSNTILNDYRQFQGSITFGGPVQFDDITVEFADGRITFISKEYLGFGKNVNTVGKLDFYINASGTVRMESGNVTHFFVPTVDTDTHLMLGGTVYVGGLWLGLNTFSKKLDIEVYDDARVGNFYIGGQAKSFTGSTNIIAAGGNLGSISVYNQEYYKGKTNMLFVSPDDYIPNIAGDSHMILFDQSDKPEISSSVKEFLTDGALKATETANPSASVEDGFVEMSYTIKCINADGSEAVYPFSKYVLVIPDKYVLSDNFAVYAFNGSSYINCNSIVSNNRLIFDIVDGATLYSIVHMGEKAKVKETDPDPIPGDNPGGTDVIDPIESDKPADPAGPGGDQGSDTEKEPFKINLTAIIIIAMIAVTAVVEIIILRGGKKKSA